MSKIKCLLLTIFLSTSCYLNSNEIEQFIHKRNAEILREILREPANLYFEDENWFINDRYLILVGKLSMIKEIIEYQEKKR